MDNKINKKIKNLIIYIVFISLFLASLFILLNDRLDLLTNMIKPVEKAGGIIEIINESTDWYYVEEGKNPGVGNVWSTDNYDASSWKKGYGEFVGGEDRRTPSYFFRYEFNIEEDMLEAIKAMEGIVEYDDAVIIYLNGSIIFAGNVPAGGYDSNLDMGASEIMEDKEIKSFEVTDLSSLKQGKNIIGVELHRANAESGDIYFNFKKLELSKVELKKSLYNMDGLVLKHGDIDNEIFVNWMTNSPEFFRLEYIEMEKYKEEKDFARYGETILMGRKKIYNENLYINNVKINRLKDDTQYLYRILKIGSIQASNSYSFRTGKRKGFSFLFLESPSILSESLDEFSLEWNRLLTKSNDLVGNVDFMITSMNQDYKSKSKLQTQQRFMMFRKPILLKTIPILNILTDTTEDKYASQFYQTQFNRKTENEQGNYYVVYQDTLIIHLNSNDIDYNQHKLFIEEAINKTNRNWVIVATHNIENNKKILDICDEIGIDLVLRDEKYITKVSVDNDKLLIEEYRLEDITKINEYIVEK